MRRRLLLFGLKLLVSAGLIGWLWTRFDVPAAFAVLLEIDRMAAMAAFAILLLHGVLSAWRWRTIVSLQGGALAWRAALRLFFVSMFFNQTLSTTVGGDAARVWMLHAGGTSVGMAAGGVLLERVAGLLALAPLILIGAGLLPGPAHPGLWGVLGLAALVPLIVLPATRFVRSGSRWRAALGRFAETGRRVLFSAGGLAVLGQSLVIHLGAGLAVFLLAHGIGASPGPAVCLVLTPPVLLIATLPVSFGGWGPREAALVWLFGIFGIAAAPALAVSVGLGVLVMAAGLPGAALWRLGRPQPRPAPEA